MSKTTIGQLEEYAGTISQFDPQEVREQKEQLREFLNIMGGAIVAREPYSFDFSGRITVSVGDEDKLAIKIEATDGSLMGQICEAVVALDGMDRDSFHKCEEKDCPNVFFRSHKKRGVCSDRCARVAWNKNVQKKRAALKKKATK